MFAAQEKAAKPVTINGTVSAVSETSVTVVDTNKAEQIITIDAKTKITKGGKAATAADIKANDAVVVVANKGEGDVLTAVSIKVS
jgi:predicted RNA-binding protein